MPSNLSDFKFTAKDHPIKNGWTQDNPIKINPIKSNLIERQIKDRLKNEIKGQIIAHRGAPRLAPENTLSSFKMAAKLQAQWIEFDTQPCASGEWIVIHDHTLERTTNGRGKVIDTPYALLKTLDAGSWFHIDFKGESVPLLSDVLILLQRLGIRPNIEVKLEQQYVHEQQNKGEQDKREQRDTVDQKKLPFESHLTTFASILTNYWPKDALPPLISSFDVNTLLLLQKVLPQSPLGMNVDHLTPELFDQIKNLDLFSVHCDYENLPNGIIPQEILSLLKQNELALLLYTINNKQTAKEFLEHNVDAVFSDIPNLLK